MELDPWLMPPSPTIQIRLEPPLKEVWMEEAAARNMTLSEMLRNAVELYLSQVPRPPDTSEEDRRVAHDAVFKFFSDMGLT